MDKRMITQGKWTAEKYGKTIAIWGLKGDMKSMVAKMNDFNPPEVMQANAKIISQAPETLRQRDGLLDVLKQLVRLADRALRRDEIFRGKALNEIGNKAEQAIASVEGSDNG